MANDFYTHSGHPGTRAPRSSALLRAEFGSIEDGFDKLPDISTPNLFTVTDGSAMVGKTAAQAKVILALNNCDNTSDLDKPISTLTQAALADRPRFADFAAAFSASGYQNFAHPDEVDKIIVIQWGSVTTNPSPNTEGNHSSAFPLAFDEIYALVARDNLSATSESTKVYTPTKTGFRTKSTYPSTSVHFVAVGCINLV